MIKNKYISLVMPCKNEERALQEVLKNAPRLIDEIIVVDNNSNDKTVKIARQFKVKVVKDRRSEDGIGYGYALARGIKEAIGDMIVCMDGDGSYPTSKISSLIEYLERENLDFLSCNRLPFQKKKKMSGVRAFGIRILNLFIWTLFGYRINDCLTGMWVFRRKVTHDLTLFEGGWNFSLEIKLNAITNPKIRFAEHYIPYHDRVFDSSKQNLFKTGLQHLLFLLKFKLNPSKEGISLLQPETTISPA